jgi:hypothetical protein
MKNSISLLKSLNQQAVSTIHKIAPPKGKKKKNKTLDALNTESYSKMRQEKIRKRKEFRTKHLGKKEEEKTAELAVSSLEYFEITNNISESEKKNKDLISSFTKV